MATPAELARLRQLIDELDPAGEWPDELLETILDETQNADGTVNLRKAAAEVWEAKTAVFISLVDVTESGSSRRMSQAFDHAQKMALMFRGTSEDPSLADLVSRPQSQKIVRPSRG